MHNVTFISDSINKDCSSLMVLGNDEYQIHYKFYKKIVSIFIIIIKSQV